MKFFLAILPIVFVLNGQAQSVQNIKILDPISEEAVDTIVLPSGKRALQTSGLVQIEQLFGQDPQASTWFYIGDQFDADGVGLSGDTVRVEIVAAATPLDLIYPAVDVTTTVTPAILASTNPERALAEQICTDLDNDVNFTSAQWRCIVMSDFSGVFIHSNLFNEFGTRTGCVLPLKCFAVTATGTTVVTEVFTELVTRGLSTELSRSPNDPRRGVLAISGSISINAESISNLIIDTLKTVGAVDEMSGTGDIGSDFFFLADATNINNFFIQKLSCFCQGNGIQFGKFCSSNNDLTNGLQFTIVSEGNITLFPLIHTTDDFKHIFTFGDPTQFGLDIQSGVDDLVATSEFNPPVLLSAGSGDKIAVTKQDNITGVNTLKCRVFGFKRRR